jgi:GNAT superfamily N-acetyltransferase
MSTINIRPLRPGDEAALEDFLLARLETSMFLLSNARAAGLAYHGQRYEGDYVAAFDGSQIVGVVAHFWNDFLHFQVGAQLETLWRATVTTSGRPIKGLVGPGDQVGRMLERLQITAAQTQMNERETLFRLSLNQLQVPPALAAGRVQGRQLAMEDLPQVSAWFAEYAIETLGLSPGAETAAQGRERANHHLAEGTTWVVEAAGQRVAMSSFNARIREAVQVGGVYTPPALRGHGYARAVVAASLLHARAAGATLAILFTGQENHAAQRAYRSLGFQPIGDFQLVILREGMRVDR